MPPYSIAGKVVLVTGAAKRLGRAIALDMASRGARIAVHYRGSQADAEATVAEIRGLGADAAVFQADLRDPSAVAALVARVVAHFGQLDVMVAAAAVFERTPWPTVEVKDWDFHIGSNLTSTFLLCRAATPVMADGGVIITFGDWSGQRAYRDYLPYCVSKAGVIALTQALAQEVAPRLRVNCICPGSVLPPEDAPPEKIAAIAAQTPLGRLGSPDDIVASVRYLVEGSDFTTGTILTCDGGRLVANGRVY